MPRTRKMPLDSPQITSTLQGLHLERTAVFQEACGELKRSSLPKKQREEPNRRRCRIIFVFDLDALTVEEVPSNRAFLPAILCGEMWYACWNIRHNRHYSWG